MWLRVQNGTLQWKQYAEVLKWNSSWCRILCKLVRVLHNPYFRANVIWIHTACSSSDTYKTYIKREWQLLKGTQHAYKRTTWTTVWAETLYLKAQSSMCSFVLFELCHCSIATHSYDPLIWSAVRQCFLKFPCWENLLKPWRHQHFVYQTK